MNLFITTLLLATTFTTLAQARIIQLGWEKIEGATKYELKLLKIKNDVKKEIKTYSLDTTSWSEELKPGNYAYQIRTLDYRNVPGDWSEEGLFKVKFPDIKVISPLKNQSIYLESNNLAKIIFKWVRVKSRNTYQFYLLNQNMKVIKSEYLQSSGIEITLNKKGTYYWKVINTDSGPEEHSKDEIREDIKRNSFIILPPRIPAPAIDLSQKKSKLKISWESSPLSKKFKVLILKKKKNGWKRIYKKKTRKRSIYIKSKKLRRGYYKLDIFSYGKGQVSAPGTLYFNWNRKKLSNMSSDQPVQKQHLQYLKEKGGKTPYIVEGGFSLINKDYSGNVTATETQISDTLSGNRFYANTTYNRLDKKSYQLNVSYENIVSSQDKWSFINLEAFYNFNFKKFILGTGLFYKEYPYIFGDGVEGTFERLKSSNIGLITQAKYRYKLTEKNEIGILIKAHIAALGIKTPPNLSQELTFGGNLALYYKFAVKTDVSIGISAIKVNDSVKYSTEQITTNGGEISFFAVIDL